MSMEIKVKSVDNGDFFKDIRLCIENKFTNYFSFLRKFERRKRQVLKV
jgi:hypothetical protein